MTRRHSPEEDEYRRHKVRQRIKGRNTCLGCLLLLVVAPVVVVVGIYLGNRVLVSSGADKALREFQDKQRQYDQDGRRRPAPPATP